MDLDNTSKRRSSVQILQPCQIAPPEPTGGIDASDRANIIWTYSGISAYDIIDLSHTLTITDSVVAIGNNYNQSVSNTLTITDSAIAGVLNQSISNTISILDFVVQNYDFINTTHNDLHISDDSHGRLSVTILSLHHDLHFLETVVGDISVQQVSVNNILDIVETVSRIREEENLSHTLTITDSVIGSLGLEHTLNIIETLDYNQSKGLIHTLNIIDQVVPTSDRHFALSTTLNIRDSVIAYNVNKVSLCAYSSIGLPAVPIYSLD
jgi:hypothetical protein